jgi:hypothetical protein
MQNAFKTIKNGRDLLNFLQSCTDEELDLPIFRTDNGPDYGPFYDEVEQVTIESVYVDGWSKPLRWGIIL